MHGVPPENMACSWDIPFYTPQPSNVTGDKATQLHWDHNAYWGGEPAPLAKELCIQGAIGANEAIDCALYIIILLTVIFLDYALNCVSFSYAFN